MQEGLQSQREPNTKESFIYKENSNKQDHNTKETQETISKKTAWIREDIGTYSHTTVSTDQQFHQMKPFQLIHVSMNQSSTTQYLIGMNLLKQMVSCL